MNKQRRVEPIPEEFAIYEEVCEFWDAHDTADYPDAFQTVDVEVSEVWKSSSYGGVKYSYLSKKQYRDEGILDRQRAALTSRPRSHS